MELATQYSEELSKIIKEQKTVLSGIKRLVNLGIFQKSYSIFITFQASCLKSLCYNTKENICKDICYTNKGICFKESFKALIESIFLIQNSLKNSFKLLKRLLMAEQQFKA
ncbi:TPA: hypothetical protein RZK46_000618 [Campylobacter coli]|nr:hypothetical protein [Campylobacter coli]